jgi:methyl-accepting chemotaxis protein
LLAVRQFVVQPLSWLTVCFTKLAHGDTTNELNEVSRNDEIGNLGRAYRDFRQIVLDAEVGRAKVHEQDQMLATARHRAEIDKARSDAHKTDALRTMIEQVERETKIAVRGVTDLMEQMTTITVEMSGTASRLSQTSNSVSIVAEEALASMQSASSSTEELSASIVGVADRIHGAKVTSDEAVTASHRASQTIEALSKVVTEINEVTGLIAQITRQTGLLALNAGVEAARAGNEGLGFAVIAREVRYLAEQTSAATDKIGGLIRQVEVSTRGAVTAVRNISRAIDRVSRASEDITNAMKNQVSTTKLIAVNVNGTTASVTDVTKQIQNVANEVQGSQVMAQNVEDVCLQAAEKVKILQKALVKIVRTCSIEVDRRAKKRFEINRLGMIDVEGTMVSVTVVDMSEGGAQLIGTIAPSAQSFTLHLPGIKMILPARVVEQRDGAIHAAFTIGEEEQFQLGEILPRIAAGVPSSGEARAA